MSNSSMSREGSRGGELDPEVRSICHSGTMGMPSPMPWSSCVLNWGWPMTSIETLMPVRWNVGQMEIRQ
jgi:hypothetical protein